MKLAFMEKGILLNLLLRELDNADFILKDRNTEDNRDYIKNLMIKIQDCEDE